MLAETSSSVDDEASVTANEGMESYHGSIKVGEAVQRRETMELGEMTPILQEAIKWRLYLVHAFFCAVSFVVGKFLGFHVLLCLGPKLC